MLDGHGLAGPDLERGVALRTEAAVLASATIRISHDPNDVPRRVVQTDGKVGRLPHGCGKSPFRLVKSQARAIDGGPKKVGGYAQEGGPD